MVKKVFSAHNDPPISIWITFWELFGLKKRKKKFRKKTIFEFLFCFFSRIQLPYEFDIFSSIVFDSPLKNANLGRKYEKEEECANGNWHGDGNVPRKKSPRWYFFFFFFFFFFFLKVYCTDHFLIDFTPYVCLKTPKEFLGIPDFFSKIPKRKIFSKKHPPLKSNFFC